MLTIVLLALSAQTQITETDVPEILDAVVDFLVSDTAFAGDTTFSDQNPLKSRPMFVSTEPTWSFRQVLGSYVSSRLLETGRRYTARADAEVLVCRSGPDSCAVVRNGVLLTTSIITFGAKPGDYELRLSVRWNDPRSAGKLRQMVFKLTMSKIDERWRVTGSRMFGDVYPEY